MGTIKTIFKTQSKCHMCYCSLLVFYKYRELEAIADLFKSFT